MTSATQERFRKEIVKRDQLCILSRLCSEVCEAAHLVNKAEIKPSNKNLMFTPKNGILLNSNLHKEFDLNYWTIDMNQERWDILKKDLNPEKTTSYRCDIKLYPLGQKKFDINMKLDIFNYLDTGIDIPLECMPFVIHRNAIYKKQLENNYITSDEIEQGLKIEFKTKKTKTPNKKRKNKASLDQPSKKIKRYTKIKLELIKGWINTQPIFPDKQLRQNFCERNELDIKLFETRFTKMWKKYKS